MRRPKVIKLSVGFGHCHLHIRCNHCGNQRFCDPADIPANVGWECPLDALSKRLGCGKCGTRGARIDVVAAVHQGAPEALVPFCLLGPGPIL